MYGPDVTFLGVRKADLEQPESFAGADVVVVGAPFDGGTSYRPGTRFGPLAIRTTDYLSPDASRPHLALRVDPLRELWVVDVGDVPMPPGDIETSVQRLEQAVVGLDVVELSPPYDGPGQVTAFLANRIVLEALSGIAKRRHDATPTEPAPSPDTR